VTPDQDSLTTRADIESLVRSLFEPVRRNYSPTGAGITLDLSDARNPLDARMEMLVRPLWGLAPLAAGGGRFDHWDRLREMLAAGTDPGHPDAWGAAADYDQRLVEMASVAAGILIAPNELWEPFNQAQQAHILVSLRHAEAALPHDNNWWFFRVMVQLALRRVGAHVNVDAETQALNRIDRFGREAGWYSDGARRGAPDRADWYSAYVFHVYGLLYAWSGLGSEARSEQFRERAALFAGQLCQWYAPGGEALPFGRSLTYRSAQAAFWAMLAAADVEALPWAQAKGIYLRNLRFWQPALTNRGELTPPGYVVASNALVEEYTNAGSPYWTFKAFLALLAGPHHGFWLADEQPLPEMAGPVVQTVPGLILSRDHHQVLALSSKQMSSHHDGGVAKYCRFAYSSACGFSVDAPGVDGEPVSDSTLTLTDAEGVTMARRDPTLCRIEGDVGLSTWKPWPNVAVHTALSGSAPWHTRVHLVTTSRPLVATDWGFAVDANDAKVDVVEGDQCSVSIDANGLRSGIAQLRGPARRAGVRRGAAGTNLLVHEPLIPMVEGRLDPGTHIIVIRVLAGITGERLATASVQDSQIDHMVRLLRQQQRRSRWSWFSIQSCRKLLGRLRAAARRVARLRPWNR